MCYQLPALLLPRITVVVSPLMSLMKDQVENLKEKKGFLKVANLNLDSNVEENDLIIFAGATVDGEILKDELCQFLLTLNSNSEDDLHNFNSNKVDKVYQEALLQECPPED